MIRITILRPKKLREHAAISPPTVGPLVPPLAQKFVVHWFATYGVHLHPLHPLGYAHAVLTVYSFQHVVSCRFTLFSALLHHQATANFPVESFKRLLFDVDGWWIRYSWKYYVIDYVRAQYRYAIQVCVMRVQIWAAGAMPGNASPNDIESSQSSWGVGANITTKLINQTGEVRFAVLLVSE